MTDLDTDYLVVGAGAAGLAFTDALVHASDVDVVLVDRRHEPGGHWNDAYPFVQLHQPSAFYGVNSLTLGTDSIDVEGPNAGFYERATAAELRAYFRVALDQLLDTGRVRFLGGCEYLLDRSHGHTLRGVATDEKSAVGVRRRLVDASYLETAVPSTHTPSFAVDDDAWFVPVNALSSIPDADGFTILGGGKTSMDACSWLLDHSVPPEAIRWVRPRDAWLLDRRFAQPLDLLTATIDGLSLQLEAAAQAETVPELFERLEAAEQLIRLDPDVEPSMYHCATLSRLETDQLRQITDVARLGHVTHVGSDRVDLVHGSIPNTAAAWSSTAPPTDSDVSPPCRSSDRVASPRSRSGRASRRSTPRWSATSRPATPTTTPRTRSARRTGIRTQRPTGWRTPRSARRPSTGGDRMPSCPPGSTRPGSTPLEGSPTTSASRTWSLRSRD